jgi:hypothetical protein
MWRSPKFGKTSMAPKSPSHLPATGIGPVMSASRRTAREAPLRRSCGTEDGVAGRELRDGRNNHQRKCTAPARAASAAREFGWSQVNGKMTIADPAVTEPTALAALALAGGADGTNSVCPRGFRDRTFPTARAKVPILKFAEKNDRSHANSHLIGRQSNTGKGRA